MPLISALCSLRNILINPLALPCHSHSKMRDVWMMCNTSSAKSQSVLSPNRVALSCLISKPHPAICQLIKRLAQSAWIAAQHQKECLPTLLGEYFLHSVSTSPKKAMKSLMVRHHLSISH